MRFDWRRLCRTSLLSTFIVILLFPTMPQAADIYASQGRNCQGVQILGQINKGDDSTASSQNFLRSKIATPPTLKSCLQEET